MLAGGTREVELTTRIPVYMTYFTAAMVDRDRTLRTFGDPHRHRTSMGAVLFAMLRSRSRHASL